MRRVNLFVAFLMTFSILACGQIDKETAKNIEKVVEYFNNEEYEKAVTYADMLIEKDSFDYVSWTLKGRALFNLGKEQQGIDAVNKAIEIKPDYYEAYGFRAVLYHLTGEYEVSQIIPDIDMALSEEPSNPELIKIKAGLLYKSKQFAKAISEYDKLLKIDPKAYEIIILIATTNKELGNKELALKGYTQAIEIQPKLSFAYEERAYFFIENEQFEKAIADYNKLIEIIPESLEFRSIKAYTLNNRGFAYFKINKNDIALTDINQSLKLLPTNSYAYKNRALVFLYNNEMDKGCSDLQKAIELGYSELYGNEVEKLINENCK